MLIRILSGIFYVIVLSFSVWFGPKSFSVLLFIFCVLCLYEYAQITKLNFNLTAGLILLSLIMLTTHSKIRFISMDTAVGFIKIPYLILLASIILITFSREKIIKTIGTLLFGVIYITIPFYLSLSFINDRDNFIWIFILFMVNDSFAYIVGKKWGKRKLIPEISPNKTIEGLLGGIFFSLLLGIILQYTLPQPSFNWIFIALLSGILGSIGDLVESKLKRETQRKDTGNLIPGHGGFLDRLDSFIFAIPFIYMYIYG